MKIWIDEAGEGGARSVSFSSPAGHATAVWRGEKLPDPGDYDVELDIPVELRWGRDLRERENLAPGIEQTSDGYRLAGRAVDLGSDGVLAIDLGGSIVMLDTEGTPPTNVVGKMVEFDSPVLELYPTNI
ncbi:MAG: hypothetical protein QOI98_3046 [Solirubrobacteraceae bacterium]|jgi:hypothetical protein|nr:hypothetical protein [Solirubrobacteraceae bacterium]